MHISSAVSETKVNTGWVSMGATEWGDRSLQAHEPLFHEGDETSHFFEVLEGVLCAYKIFADGRRQVISFAFPGDLVGFGHGSAYRFDCDALSRARVRCVPKSSILRAIKERPDLGERLLDAAAGEVAHMQELSVLLGRKSAIEKLASFLVSLSERTSPESDGSAQVALPMTRADMADFLGLTVETVSRNMTKLRVMKIIDLPHSATLEVRDMARLRALADCEDNLY
ncbi:MAG TPA: helix-turn-helix domain-containing protein [Devosiaceae bacterium]